MIYHERSEDEQAELHEIVENSVESEELRQEVIQMGKTMAEVLRERGRLEGEAKAAIETRQQTLVRLLRKRFGDVPADVVRTVESTTDVDRLDEWLDRFATARTLDELEINGQKSDGRGQ